MVEQSRSSSSTSTADPFVEQFRMKAGQAKQHGLDENSSSCEVLLTTASKVITNALLLRPRGPSFSQNVFNDENNNNISNLTCMGKHRRTFKTCLAGNSESNNNNNDYRCGDARAVPVKHPRTHSMSTSPLSAAPSQHSSFSSVSSTSPAAALAIALAIEEELRNETPKQRFERHKQSLFQVYYQWQKRPARLKSWSQLHADPRKTVCLISGPTATGKSSLALQLQSLVTNNTTSTTSDSRNNATSTGTVTTTSTTATPPESLPGLFLQGVVDPLSDSQSANSAPVLSIFVHLLSQQNRGQSSTTRNNNNNSCSKNSCSSIYNTIFAEWKIAIQRLLRKRDLELLCYLLPELQTFLYGKGKSNCSSTTDNNNADLSAAESGKKRKQAEAGDDVVPNNQKTVTATTTMTVPCMWTEKRLQFVCRKLLQTLLSLGRPIVLLMEDLHWISKEALDFLIAVIQDMDILLIGTYRDNHYDGEETDKWNDGGNNRHEYEHPYNDDGISLSQIRACLESAMGDLTHIALRNLSKNDVRQMLADSFALETAEDAAALHEYVYDLSQGSPTCMEHVLRNLQNFHILSFDEDSRRWILERRALQVNEPRFEDLVRSRVLTLPTVVQETLKIAACIGSHINPRLLSVVTGGPVIEHLQTAAAQGIVIIDHIDEHIIHFTHEIIRQAAYNLIPESDRASFHLHIGGRIWRNLSEHEADELICVVVEQLMHGDKILVDQKDRVAVACACLRAAKKAAESADFHTSLTYLRHGIALLGESSWRDEYETTLRLHNAAAEACYCTALFEEVDSLVNTILTNARHFSDTLQARSTHIYALSSREQFSEAVAVGLATLEKLGEPLPLKPNAYHVHTALRRVKRLLKGRSDESLLRLPKMTDKNKITSMQIFTHMCFAAFCHEPMLGPLLTLRMVEMTVKHGISTFSCLGFVAYGVMLASGDFEEGCRYGKVAMAMYEQGKEESFLCRLYAAYYGCVSCWSQPYTSCLEPMKKAFSVGLRTGDIESAALTAYIYGWNSYESSTLPSLEKELKSFIQRLRVTGQVASISLVEPLWRMVLVLMGKSCGSTITSADTAVASPLIHDEKDHSTNRPLHRWSVFCAMILDYFAGDYSTAETRIETCKKTLDHYCGGTDVAGVLFWECMTMLALARQRRGRAKRRYVRHVRRRLVTLERWATHAPSNFAGKKLLIQAELDAIRGKHHKAITNYESAISDFQTSGLLMPQALANERLAKYCLDSSDRTVAMSHMDEAIRLYSKWGGIEKVEQLKNEFGLC